MVPLMVPLSFHQRVVLAEGEEVDWSRQKPWLKHFVMVSLMLSCRQNDFAFFPFPWLV